MLQRSPDGPVWVTCSEHVCIEVVRHQRPCPNNTGCCFSYFFLVLLRTLRAPQVTTGAAGLQKPGLLQTVEETNLTTKKQCALIF